MKFVKFISTLVTCLVAWFGLLSIYLMLGLIMGWKHGGGFIPIMILLYIMLRTWGVIAAKSGGVFVSIIMYIIATVWCWGILIVYLMVMITMQLEPGGGHGIILLPAIICSWLAFTRDR